MAAKPPFLPNFLFLQSTDLLPPGGKSRELLLALSPYSGVFPTVPCRAELLLNLCPFISNTLACPWGVATDHTG